jgi:hypothetical protein
LVDSVAKRTDHATSAHVHDEMGWWLATQRIMQQMIETVPSPV